MFDQGLQGLFGLGLDYMGAKQEQRWAKQASRVQMDFQERMSNTAYQRAMADMRKAGINPIMVSKLGGASTPTGAMAVTPKLGNMGSNAIKNMATAKGMQLTNSQIKNTDASTLTQESIASKNKADTMLTTAKEIHQNLVNENQRLANSVLAKNIINAEIVTGKQ